MCVVVDQLSIDADPNLSSFIDLVTGVYEHIALLIEAKQPFVETFFGAARRLHRRNTCLQGRGGWCCSSS